MSADAAMTAQPAGHAPARIVFLGSGAFAVPMLDALRSLPAVAIVGVVSTPDRPVGRGGRLAPTPVAASARETGLELLQPERIRDPRAIAALAALAADLGVLADYGQIVPPAVLDLAPHGILNVHPSLLPRHRGATPIPATILAGDRETGVTIIRMEAGLDTGSIVATERWALAGDETAPELEREAAARGAALLARTVPEWLAGRRVAVPQDDAAATLTRPFRREDGRLDPGRPALALERQVRALQPWPGTFVETAIGRLVVLRAAVAAGAATDRPGDIVADGDGLALATGEGRLRLLQVQPGGGRAMSIAELRRGAGRTLAGTRVVAAPTS